ncbi:hypothetical protein [Thermoactinomyces sp. DSM 45892]|uniref:hypothetical protein n=1 Tax=Thermoactinomyces sp. DSM 45892 TaxID=1882753 RepID=UPI00089D0708|nr:hypothetical protein [Thermoactinomyces sp. DSM 45892]SDX95823.1 hypothetical protein SAMN05444416_101102 [Thermoactinomyces sp. DSM 45892]
MAFNLHGLRAIGEEEIKKLLLQEGKQLERIAKHTWQKYLDSYHPIEYIRTGASMKAIKLGRIERLSSLEYGIRLEFVDDLSYHDSVIRGGDQGHAIMLISDGWKATQGRQAKVYRFGYYEGFQYIEQVLKAYEQSKPDLVQIQFHWNGAYTR